MNLTSLAYAECEYCGKSFRRPQHGSGNMFRAVSFCGEECRKMSKSRVPLYELKSDKAVLVGKIERFRRAYASGLERDSLYEIFGKSAVDSWEAHMLRPEDKRSRAVETKKAPRSSDDVGFRSFYAWTGTRPLTRKESKNRLEYYMSLPYRASNFP